MTNDEPLSRRALADLVETAAETIKVLRQVNDRLMQDSRDADELARQAAFWRQVAIGRGASANDYRKHMEALNGRR